jgi:hypothetical protein
MVAPNTPSSISGSASARLADGVQRQRHQRHDAALAAVVGAQHGHVLERDDHGQAPENQRDDAQQLLYA